MTFPITPPPELVQQWIEETRSRDCIGAYPADLEQCVATRAAQWGADQQLAEDAKWLDHNALNEPHLRITPVGESLKEAMRPKPPSLKEQALRILVENGTTLDGRIELEPEDIPIIRQALEALPND